MKPKKWFYIGAAVLVGATAFTQVEDYHEVSKNLDIFASVYKEVNTSYVDEVQPGSLIREAIDGMLGSLDPYTNFYSESQSQDYRFQVTGTYGGIGAIINKHGENLVVSRVHEGYPAHTAGIIAGDILKKVDGKSVEGKTSSDLSDLLKGTAGTTIVITIDRPYEGVKEFTFKRAQVKVKNVPYFGMVDDKTGYIKLTGFTPDAGNEVYNAAKTLKGQGAKSIILDLRGNGGGLLHEAVNIVNVFVKKNQIVVTTKGKNQKDGEYKTLNAPLDLDIPLAVLIDKGSASASEIVSGTIQDLDRGVIIGTQSFGKGLVQTSRVLTYNTQMKITTSKYYIPSGRCIQRLDYSNKKDGHAISVADSLKRIFYTANKRKVIDGEGVNPDVVVGMDILSKIGSSLINNYLIFDYATLYRHKNDSIVSAKNFRFTDSDFEDFKRFLSDKEYSYETETERAIKQLEKEAEDEKYSSSLKASIDALKADFEKNKQADLERHKAEIMQLLESEIASRYYFDRAEIETTFDSDPDINKAISVFSSPQYTLLLKGTN